MTASELLEKAAQVAERLDHCKKVYAQTIDGNDQCCTLGAIRIATSPTGRYYDYKLSDTYDMAKYYVAQALGVLEYFDIPVWNDLATTTKADVVARLRAAAALAREAGK